MTVHRPLLREIRALAEEYPSVDECLEAAVSRGMLPETATSDGHRKFVSSDGKRLETFIAWASLGWERIATAEALASEFHRNSADAIKPLRNIEWCIGGPLEIGDDPAEAALAEMGLYASVGLDGRDVCLHMPWRNSTGVPAIDALLGGLHSGSLIVICGPPGAYKSTLAVMIAAGSTQQGRVPYYGADIGTRGSHVERSLATQGFIDPRFRLELNRARDHVDLFSRSRCDALIIDNDYYTTSEAIRDICEDARMAARSGGRVSIVTLFQTRNGDEPSGAGFVADVILSTSLGGGALTIAARKNRYGDRRASVRMARDASGRLVWDGLRSVA